MYGIDELRWGITFLQTDTGLSFEDRGRLLYHATEMYLEQESERKVKGDAFEGVLHDTGKHRHTGAFYGEEFEAELDTDHGKSIVRFLVTERVNGRFN